MSHERKKKLRFEPLEWRVVLSLPAGAPPALETGFVPTADQHETSISPAELDVFPRDIVDRFSHAAGTPIYPFESFFHRGADSVQEDDPSMASLSLDSASSVQWMDQLRQIERVSADDSTATVPSLYSYLHASPATLEPTPEVGSPVPFFPYREGSFSPYDTSIESNPLDIDDLLARALGKPGRLDSAWDHLRPDVAMRINEFFEPLGLANLPPGGRPFFGNDVFSFYSETETGSFSDHAADGTDLASWETAADRFVVSSYVATSSVFSESFQAEWFATTSLFTEPTFYGRDSMSSLSVSSEIVVDLSASVLTQEGWSDPLSSRTRSDTTTEGGLVELPGRSSTLSVQRQVSDNKNLSYRFELDSIDAESTIRNRLKIDGDPTADATSADEARQPVQVVSGDGAEGGMVDVGLVAEVTGTDAERLALNAAAPGAAGRDSEEKASRDGIEMDVGLGLFRVFDLAVLDDGGDGNTDRPAESDQPAADTPPVEQASIPLRTDLSMADESSEREDSPIYHGAIFLPAVLFVSWGYARHYRWNRRQTPLDEKEPLDDSTD